MNTLYALSVLLILSTLSTLWMKKIMHAIYTLSFQSLVLGVIALWIAIRTHVIELYVVAVLVVFVKSFLIPLVLRYTMIKIDIHRETQKLISREVSVLIGAGLVVVGYVATNHMHLVQGTMEQRLLPMSIAMLLCGLYIMLTHQKAIMQGIGLIIMENGLFLIALATTHGMPLVVDIGLFFDVFVIVVLMSMLTYRMDQVFHSIHTDHLRNLKG